MPAHSLIFAGRWFRRLLLVALLPTALLSCKKNKKDDPKPVDITNAVRLEFQHQAPDGSPLRLNTTHQTTTGEPYKLSLLTYYVSNIKLIRADGTAWAAPNSYYLVRVPGLPAANPVLTIPAVPAGNFTAIEFGLGVDSVANHHGDQTGALSPNNGMQWNWSTGYKFWVMEGTHVPTTGPAQDLTYHIGFDAQYRTIRLALPQALTVTAAIAPQATVEVSLRPFFTGIDFADPAHRTVMGNSPTAARIANNLATMFRVTAVSNL